VMVAIGILPAAQALRIDDRHFITTPVNSNVKSIFRARPLTHTTFMHVRVQEEEIPVRLRLTHVETVNTIADLS